MRKFLWKVLPQHKYAINAQMLGDDAILAWSNLGYWSDTQASYIQAAQALADHLAHALHLSPHDHLLDLGCGQGASLKHWIEHYHPTRIEAVELQSACVELIQQHLPDIHIHRYSFLDLAQLYPIKPFSVIISIDAAYHCNLNQLLLSISKVLAENGRVGFHTLMLTEKWQQLTNFQRLPYQTMLKSADVNVQDLLFRQGIKQALKDQKFKNIQIEDLSQSVLAGFAHYIDQRKLKTHNLDAFKIKVTAKLCQKLFDDGFVRYVQITAEK